MSIDLKGELACPYCGTKVHLSDREYDEYKKFRLNMLHYLRSAADEKADAADGTFIWDQGVTVRFRADDGSDVDVKYLFHSETDGIEMFVARESVIYVFPATKLSYIEKMQEQVGRLSYPPAAIKDLGKSFPLVKARIKLSDGRVLLAVSKPENAYPLFAFGRLEYEHVAWIISRMENICCVLEYSEIAHNGLSLESLFINPKTHEAFLYGNWWMAEKKSSLNKGDLEAVRKIAKQLLGGSVSGIPEKFAAFVEGRPSADAYQDFSKWDEVIETALGGHKFVKF